MMVRNTGFCFGVTGPVKEVSRQVAKTIRKEGVNNLIIWLLTFSTGNSSHILHALIHIFVRLLLMIDGCKNSLIYRTLFLLSVLLIAITFNSNANYTSGHEFY